jgi:hypothetical protein
MKALRILLLLVFLQVATSTFNTTEFWKKSLNSTEPLHFEAYAGIPVTMQATNKSIGIDQRAPAVCIISYSAQWAAASTTPPVAFHLSSGSMEGQEAAPFSEPFAKTDPSVSWRTKQSCSTILGIFLHTCSTLTNL